MALSFQECLAIQQGEIVDNLIDNLVEKFSCLLIIFERDKKN